MNIKRFLPSYSLSLVLFLTIYTTWISDGIASRLVILEPFSVLRSTRTFSTIVKRSYSNDEWSKGFTPEFPQKSQHIKEDLEEDPQSSRSAVFFDPYRSMYFRLINGESEKASAPEAPTYSDNDMVEFSIEKKD